MSGNTVMPAEAGEAYWRDPDWDPPPLGRKLLLLTSGGVAVIGDWMRDSNLIAWSPLPKRRESMQHTEDPDHGDEL